MAATSIVSMRYIVLGGGLFIVLLALGALLLLPTPQVGTPAPAGSVIASASINPDDLAPGASNAGVAPSAEPSAAADYVLPSDTADGFTPLGPSPTPTPRSVASPPAEPPLNACSLYSSAQLSSLTGLDVGEEQVANLNAADLGADVPAVDSEGRARQCYWAAEDGAPLIMISVNVSPQDMNADLSARRGEQGESGYDYRALMFGNEMLDGAYLISCRNCPSQTFTHGLLYTSLVQFEVLVERDPDDGGKEAAGEILVDLERRIRPG